MVLLLCLRVVTVLAWLSMDILQGQFWNVHLLLLLEGHWSMLLYNLGTLVACVQVGTALVHIMQPALVPAG